MPQRSSRTSRDELLRASAPPAPVEPEEAARSRAASAPGSRAAPDPVVSSGGAACGIHHLERMRLEGHQHARPAGRRPRAARSRAAPPGARGARRRTSRPSRWCPRGQRRQSRSSRRSPAPRAGWSQPSSAARHRDQLVRPRAARRAARSTAAPAAATARPCTTARLRRRIQLHARAGGRAPRAGGRSAVGSDRVERHRVLDPQRADRLAPERRQMRADPEPLAQVARMARRYVPALTVARKIDLRRRRTPTSSIRCTVTVVSRRAPPASPRRASR